MIFFAFLAEQKHTVGSWIEQPWAALCAEKTPAALLHLVINNIFLLFVRKTFY